MRATTWLPLCVGAILSAAAFAQNPKMIEVPLPPEEPVPGDPDVVTPEILVPLPVPTGGNRAPRREQRKLQGEPPTAVFGVWTVVQITELGETEDYAIKMDRAANALDTDCTITATWFDFGPPPTVPGLPSQVTVTQVQRCEKGGLGTFSSETSITSAATWSSADGVVLELPEVRADQQLIRLRIAEEAGRTPSNWVGPELRVDQGRSRYTVLAEYPPRRQKGEGRPDALHLKATNGAVWHLEPLAASE
jgi:hypothetical protein